MEDYEANKNEIYMASRGSFLDLTITETYKLLDKMSQAKELEKALYGLRKPLVHGFIH
jgi:hypothetical protein